MHKKEWEMDTCRARNISTTTSPSNHIWCSLTTLECHFSSSYLKLNWVEYYSILLPCNFTCKPNDLCAQGNVQSKILQPTLVDVGHYTFFWWLHFVLMKICTPPGFYADPEAECQGYHVCMPLFGGNVDRKMSFLCPNGTIFNQELFVCDWW